MWYRRHLTSLFSLLLMTVLLCCCKVEDDIQGIFVGKTWKLSNFCSAGKDWKHDLVPMLTPAQVDEANTEGKFQISFGDGTFSGIGSTATFSGTWRAESDGNTFSVRVTYISGTDQSELGREFISHFTNATYYLGDYNSLKIFYDEKKNFVLFRPLK